MAAVKLKITSKIEKPQKNYFLNGSALRGGGGHREKNNLFGDVSVEQIPTANRLEGGGIRP